MSRRQRRAEFSCYRREVRSGLLTYLADANNPL